LLKTILTRARIDRKQSVPDDIVFPIRLASYCVRLPRLYLYKWSASEWHWYRLSGSTANTDH